MNIQDIVGTVKRKDRNNRKHRKIQPDNLYKVNVKNLSEGGAMAGVGLIHHTEIDATLDALEKSLGMPLKANVLGSVGKKEFSGDIDVAINIPKEKLQDFAAKLEASPLIQDIKKSSVFMTSVDIVGYNAENTKPGLNRTGKVQIDFMPGDPDWMKTYYHSPHEKGFDKEGGRSSKYKGTFRNIMLATMASVYQSKESDEKIEDGRPVEQQRWLWSPADGLNWISRKPKPKANGEGYTKARIDTVLKGPITNTQEIAKILGLDGPEDLYSFETLLTTIKKNYPSDVYAKIVDGFKNNGQVQDMGIPSELEDTPNEN
tara:strand:+ start:49 stop:996 length:948 start_codon:yes stop_codon:yes gene_type:complete